MFVFCNTLVVDRRKWKKRRTYKKQEYVGVLGTREDGTKSLRSSFWIRRAGKERKWFGDKMDRGRWEANWCRNKEDTGNAEKEIGRTIVTYPTFLSLHNESCVFCDFQDGNVLEQRINIEICVTLGKRFAETSRGCEGGMRWVSRPIICSCGVIKSDSSVSGEIILGRASVETFKRI